MQQAQRAAQQKDQFERNRVQRRRDFARVLTPTREPNQDFEIQCSALTSNGSRCMEREILCATEDFLDRWLGDNRDRSKAPITNNLRTLLDGARCSAHRWQA